MVGQLSTLAEHCGPLDFSCLDRVDTCQPSEATRTCIWDWLASYSGRNFSAGEVYIGVSRSYSPSASILARKTSVERLFFKIADNSRDCGPRYEVCVCETGNALEFWICHVFVNVSTSGMGTLVKKIKGMKQGAQKWGGESPHCAAPVRTETGRIQYVYNINIPVLSLPRPLHRSWETPLSRLIDTNDQRRHIIRKKGRGDFPSVVHDWSCLAHW